MRPSVLIIDDSHDTHLLVKARLKGENIDVRYASHGTAGIEMARTQPTDLILLDVDMPQPDGFEVCRCLKQDPATKDIPVIFLTGITSSEQKLKGLELGAVDYITKPFDPAELRARVNTSLRTKQLLDLISQKANVLQVSEERFRFLAENSNDIISRHEISGEFLYVSPACRAVLGFKPLEMLGRRIHEIIHEDDLAKVSALFGAQLPREASALVFRACRQDGEFVWLEATSQGVRHQETGELLEIQMSSRDITVRKKAEALEQGRARVLEMVAENRPLFEILEELVELVEEIYPAAFGSAALMTEDKFEHAAPNLPLTFRVVLEEELSRKSQYCDPAGFDRNVVVSRDITSHPVCAGLRESACAAGLRTCWAILIRSSNGSVRGIFSVFHAAMKEPDQSAVALLEMVGKLITIASEHRDLSTQLDYRAHHDWLTGLPNRLLFEDRLTHGMAKASRNNEMVALFCIDLDRFKHINDTLGHSAGDMALVEFTRRLRSVLRQTDTLARMGGDEFALIISDLKEREHALKLAEMFIRVLETPFQIAGGELFITSSIGIAIYPQDATDADALQKNADLALYRAKALGRNRFQYFSTEMLSVGVGRLGMESLLRRAIDKNELELHYQPQFDSRGILDGFEALVRWRHSKLGLVLPSVFIPLAEESGLIIDIGRWVMEEACRQQRAWQAAGFTPVKIGVNVSALQFAQPDFTETVLRCLETHPIDPKWLELELTETFVMKNMADTARKLNAIRDAGIKVALDDFGTGYSSLAYLQSLPIDKLKIDQSFVHQIKPGSEQSKSKAVIRAILSLGHSLGMNVVAEGVEHLHQLEFLNNNGCSGTQGYLWGKARPAAEVEEYFHKMPHKLSA